MMAITTSNSIKVKPDRDRDLFSNGLNVSIGSG
jgi:hypothetical protein